ncbi:MAG TPA: response regulator [Polyangiaceae bacterium]|jgi:DNA-binding response OmpR family regulator
MPTVLLVDDSPVVRHALSRRLADEGFDVRAESTAAGAAAADLAGIACAIVDVELPDGSGVDLAASLRARAPLLPIALYTATASSDLAAGPDAAWPVFRKPALDPVVAWAKARAAQAPPAAPGAPPAALQPPPTK